MARAKRLTGLHPLSYVGVEPTAPSNVIVDNRAPTSADYNGYNLCDEWLNVDTDQVYKLVDKDAHVATWTNITTSTAGAVTIDCDAGSAMPSGGLLNVLGGTNTNTSASGNTILINMDANPTFIDLTLTGDLHVQGDLTIDGTIHTALSRGVVQADAAGDLFSDEGTNGQLLISSSTGAPAWATLTAGSGVTIVNGANSITISATGTGGGGGGVTTWHLVSGTSDTMVAGDGYVSDNAGLVTLTLPAVAAQLTVLRVKGLGAGGWKIAQGAGQSIVWDATSSTTTGAGGYLASSDANDAVELLCTTANTTWSVLSSMGNITIV